MATANYGWLKEYDGNTFFPGTKPTGNSEKPVYIGTNGLPAEIDHTIKSDVPENAEFTDTKVTQKAAITTNGEYPIILANSTATTEETNTVNKTNTLKYNPSTKTLTTDTIDINSLKLNQDTHHFTDADGNVIATIDKNNGISAAKFTGPLTGNVSGNATTATNFASEKKITLTGDVSGNDSSTGSDGWTIETKVADNSHKHKLENISDLSTVTNRIATLETKTQNITADASNTYVADTLDVNSLKLNSDVYHFTDADGDIIATINSGGISATQFNGPATKLGTVDKGSTKKPIYLKAGVPTEIGYTIESNVPSGAKFTDTNTTYSLSGALSGNTFINTLKPSSGSNTTATVPAMTAATASAAGKAGLVPAPAAAKNTSFLRGDGTWSKSTDTFEVTGNATIGGTLDVNTIALNKDVYTFHDTSNNAIATIDDTGITATNFKGKVNGYTIAKDLPSTAKLTDTTYSAGNGISLSGTTFSHKDTSSATNLTANGRKYVTGLTFDTYGHVTGYTTGTETVTNTDTGATSVEVIGDGNAVTTASYNSSNRKLTLTKGVDYKPVQSAVNSPSASGSTTAFIDSISQNANGVITATKKNVDFSSYQPKGNYKTTQTAVSDPTASGTSNTFISSISQDANGKITATKATVPVTNLSNCLPITGGTITGTTDSSSTATGALIVKGGVGVAKNLYATAVYGAVWNDYAEYRQPKDIQEIPYGRVVIENGDDTLSLSTDRLQPGGNICSDTFGFAIGETKQATMPIAVSGRVLAYPAEDRNSYCAGDAVCTGPNGTVSKMTREEIREWPDRIIGYVSAIPNYKTWGQSNVSVDGRIWIKVI